MDGPPFPVPHAHEGGLPFCPMFPCSCCNRTHVTALHRSLAGALEESARAASEGSEGRFSRRCADMMRMVSCRICDPEVGTGLKPKICAATCDGWFKACRSEAVWVSESALHLIREGFPLTLVSSGRTILDLIPSVGRWCLVLPQQYPAGYLCAAN